MPSRSTYILIHVLVDADRSNRCRCEMRGWQRIAGGSLSAGVTCSSLESVSLVCVSCVYTHDPVQTEHFPWTAPSKARHCHSTAHERFDGAPRDEAVGDVPP
eukprot:6233640-Prymnesium_polylepis.1